MRVVRVRVRVTGRWGVESKDWKEGEIAVRLRVMEGEVAWRD